LQCFGRRSFRARDEELCFQTRACPPPSTTKRCGEIRERKGEIRYRPFSPPKKVLTATNSQTIIQKNGGRKMRKMGLFVVLIAGSFALTFLARLYTSPAVEVRNQRLHLSSLDGARLDSLFVGLEPQPAFLDRLNAAPERRTKCDPPGYFGRLARNIGLETAVHAFSSCSCGTVECTCLGCGYFAMAHMCQRYDCDSGFYYYPMPDGSVPNMGTRTRDYYDCNGFPSCGCSIETCSNSTCP
jgi:hypothetical protein